MGRMGKYPNLGILDALYRLSFGSDFELSKSISADGIFNEFRNNFQDATHQIFKKRLVSLKKNGYVHESKRGIFRLKDKGYKRVLVSSLSHVVFRNKKMDGYHRVIIFDIPEDQRKARDILRRKLREFECRQLQKSVYITPYVCDNEINKVAKILQVKKYVTVLEVVVRP